MNEMRRALTLIITLALSAVGGTLLGGCGSGTKTVSVSSAPPLADTTTTASTPASTTSTQTSTSTTSASASQSTSSASGTRTASEPEFTHGGSSSSGAAGQSTQAAAAVVRAHGYSPVESGAYHPDQTLGVLVGTRSGSNGSGGAQAFFFVDGKFIGTDTTDPSGSVKVVSQSDTEVTLAYPLYRSTDAPGDPSGGEAKVRFALNNGKLAPLDPIPSASSTAGLSRR